MNGNILDSKITSGVVPQGAQQPARHGASRF